MRATAAREQANLFRRRARSVKPFTELSCQWVSHDLPFLCEDRRATNAIMRSGMEPAEQGFGGLNLPTTEQVVHVGGLSGTD